MNVWDVLLLIVIFLVVAMAVWKTCKDRKRGRSCPGCGGNCASCSQHILENREDKRK
ncbi:MAG: FeoB-associated Cys-rich membrane protein [Clostridiales bacterium]|jgi:ribose/xylose/arabinose/galactoside ABC-type transport system permease subunit|nr:FeoB-associated Cys-rich membrane protein [Clostridiales bacterium]